MKTNSSHQDVGILVIDDHEISRHFILEALRQFTNNIRQAQTGCEAIEITANWFPGLIYTDIHLPDTCGLNLVQEIRSSWPQDRSLPHVIIITGDCSPGLRKTADQAGVTELLLKPVRREDIKASARRVIYRDRAVQENSLPGPVAAVDHELHNLFYRELATRLPMLDRHISRLDWKPASEILHQLIASSSMCRERDLEYRSRQLYKAIRANPEIRSVARAYHPFLRAASYARKQL